MKKCAACGHDEEEHSGVLWRGNGPGGFVKAPGLETSCMVAENQGYQEDFCSCLAFVEGSPKGEYYEHGYGGTGEKVNA